MRLEAIARALSPSLPKRPAQITRSVLNTGGGPLSFLPFLGGGGGVKTETRTEEACVSGADVVDALVKSGQAAGTDDAISLATSLQNAGLLNYVGSASSQASSRHPSAWGPDNIPASVSPTPEAFYRLKADVPAPRLGQPLNAGYTWTGPARGASVVASELRTRILRLYNEYLSADGRTVDYTALAASQEFADYVDASAELQRVSFEGLSRTQKIALFTNLYNALIIHATVAFGAPQGTAGRLAFFKGAQYVLGGHVYTSQDVEDGVLRGNSPGAASLGALLGRPSLSQGPFGMRRADGAEDPRLRVTVEPMDPRIHFALVCGAKSCPAIRVRSVFTFVYIL